MPKKIKKNPKNKKTKGIKYPQKSKIAVPQGKSLSADETFRLAVQNLQAGNLLQAEQFCQQLLALDPNNVDGNHLLGIIAAQQGGRNDVAIEFLQKALSLNPNNAEIHLNLGNVLQESNRMEESISSYRKALSLKPDYTEAHYNLGLALYRRSLYAEARPHFKKAVQLEPFNEVIRNAPPFRQYGTVETKTDNEPLDGHYGHHH